MKQPRNLPVTAGAILAITAALDGLPANAAPEVINNGSVFMTTTGTELQAHGGGIIKVIFNSSTGEYVLWAHWENGADYSEARVLIATSSTVDGNYIYHGSFRPLGYTSRDMTVFQDSDGSAYLISRALERARQLRQRQHLQLTIDLRAADSGHSGHIVLVYGRSLGPCAGSARQSVPVCLAAADFPAVLAPM